MIPDEEDPLLGTFKEDFFVIAGLKNGKPEVSSVDESI